MSPASKTETRVRVTAQVEAFVKALAPEPRRKLHGAIKQLATDRGEVAALEGELAGWHRLRVESFRVIYREHWDQGRRIIDCVYVNRRSIVYDLFHELVKNRLLEE
jgi:mRNA interferase RelE/StbE